MDTPDHVHFAAIPWCAHHLAGDRVVSRVPDCRVPKSTGEDVLFGSTLNSEAAVYRMLQVYEEPVLQTERVNESKMLLTIHSGLNGNVDVCHGGIVTTILDESIGSLMPINKIRKSVPEGVYMTAYLNTTFLKPVMTPSTILSRGWFTKVEGRKYFTQGTIEDENGTVLARAEALFILMKSAL